MYSQSHSSYPDTMSKSILRCVNACVQSGANTPQHQELKNTNSAQGEVGIYMTCRICSRRMSFGKAMLKYKMSNANRYRWHVDLGPGGRPSSGRPIFGDDSQGSSCQSTLKQLDNKVNNLMSTFFPYTYDLMPLVSTWRPQHNLPTGPRRPTTCAFKTTSTTSFNTPPISRA